MPIDVFNSVEKIRQSFKDASFLEQNPARKKALEYYFSSRGLVQLDLQREKGWPALIYPPAEKLEHTVKELEIKLKVHAGEKWSWQKNVIKSKAADTLMHVKKVSDPLFWKHLSKSIMNEQYRKDAKSIQLHSRLIAHAKYRPMVQKFVDSDEYRKQLTETVKTSPAYAHRKGLAAHAQEQNRFHADVSESLLRRTTQKLKEHEEKLLAYRELMLWSREK